MHPEPNINPSNTHKWHGKPYNFFGDYLKDKYGCRVLKAPINASLTCPNRDGFIASKGCIFCSEDGSASPTTYGADSIKKQIIQAREALSRSDQYTQYLAYFQAFTNTYGPAEHLKELYMAALKEPDIIGLMIGTRPDCLSNEILNVISEFNSQELWLELGMQTGHNRSLEYLRRGHTLEDTIDAIQRAHKKGIKVCVHIILGIPGETWGDMMKTAKIVASLPVAGIKFHQLHVIKGTELEEIYKSENYILLTMREYISTVVDFIERIPQNVLIHRLLADRNEDTLIAPAWGHHKGTVLNGIEESFKMRGTYQGFLYGSDY